MHDPTLKNLQGTCERSFAGGLDKGCQFSSSTGIVNMCGKGDKMIFCQYKTLKNSAASNDILPE